MANPDVLFTTLAGPHGNIGLITLNRPLQLNALNKSMCIAIHAQLLDWAQSEIIKAVVISGGGEKAFCAGGDIRHVYASRENTAIARDFFAQEYRLNHAIYHFPKPYIALLDGLTMGGGLGISVNGKYRIATEKLKLAMPETGIGFFTDVGASYFLSHCPGKTGWYLGLTGAVIDAADALQIGLVDVVLNSADIPDFLVALLQVVWSSDLQGTVGQVIHDFKNLVLKSTLAAHQDTINSCFSASSVEKIFNRLEQASGKWAEQTHQLLKTRSPISLKVVLEQLNRGALLNFDDCLRMEYRIANRFLNTPDFYEGIRAAVIDKDRSPHWHLANLAEISTEDVADFFAPLEDTEELAFDVAINKKTAGET